MSEKGKKKKGAGKRAAKRSADVPGVLGNLPTARPAKLGRAAREARLAAAPGEPDATAKAKPGSRPKATSKAGTKATPKAGAKAKAKRRARTPAEARAARPEAPVPRPAIAGSDVVVSIGEGSVRRRGDAGDQVPAGPRPVRAGSPDLPGPDHSSRRESPPAGPPRPEPPSGTELISTAFKAAGELAGIGLTLGAQAARRTIERLPKPW